MPTIKNPGALGILVLVAVLLAAAARVQATREQAYPTPALDGDVLYITSQATLRRLSGPYRALAADLYWIRTLQYYGGTKRRLSERPPAPATPPMLASDPSEYDSLYQFLDITTALDPRFDIAYRFGSVFLAEAYPGGAGRPDLAVRLLEKGLRERPDKWEYMEDIGFVHYWYDQDYEKAASAFDKAAAIPGAPNWLKPLAATTLAQGGDRRSSRAMWLAILQSADVDWLREQAERRLLQLQALDEMDQIQATLDALARRSAQPPSSWDTVIRAGVYPGVPVDPSKRTRYVLTPEGKVQLSPSSSLNPLPTEPVRIGPAK